MTGLTLCASGVLVGVLTLGVVAVLVLLGDGRRD